ncbi:MAG: histone-lysine N-methyltransferase [Deltaproteobacteria bacterium]|nr:histone-lysine N-methyltransferase [Deltaproteobacteria bacterium]
MAQWNSRRRLLDHIHSSHFTSLAEPNEPQLYRSIFPYTDVCKIDFDHKTQPLDPPDEMLITDTTFRDGQQARPPYKVEQIVALYGLLHKLSGPKGIIRQSEFFLYSRRDREAVEKCKALGHRFPEITGWVRAVKSELAAVKEMGLKETGILTSVSDYHIFHKMNLDRKKALDKYLGVVKDALSLGLIPRCHFEDITRADIYGFVVPFAGEIAKLREESKVGIKVRLCDTLGYGVTYPGAALPRSVPKLVRAMIEDANTPGKFLEWHGHNDFYQVLINATTAWLYGCAHANGTLLGFGERTGNTPLEALVIEYMQLRGKDDGMDPRVINEIAEYFEKEINFRIPPTTPFVGEDFNSTKAGVHADGLIKNPEIYNIFDTDKILGRPFTIAITDKSGASGIAHWVNMRLKLASDKQVDKRHPGIIKINDWVKEQYEEGRLTSIGNTELEAVARKHLPQLFMSQFDSLKEHAKKLAIELGAQLIDRSELKTMAPAVVEPVLQEFLDENPVVQFLYLVNENGYKITRNITNIVDRAKYSKAYLDQDLSDRGWFTAPMKDGKIHVSDFYTSKITGALCITVSGPLRNESDHIVGVLGADIRFEDLARMNDRAEADE